MIDLGIQNKGNGKTDDYEFKYISQLTAGDKITGEIYLGEIKSKQLKKSDVSEFYVIITDHENKQKWICGLITSYYSESGNIYGEKGGRIYELIDSISNALNDTSLNELESYSVNFDTFRETINSKVKEVTVKATLPSNPNSKAVNLNVISAIVDETKIETQSQLKPFNPDDYDLPIIKHIANMVKADNKKLTLANVQNMAEELYERGSFKDEVWDKLVRELEM